jgi:hypothetical protein
MQKLRISEELSLPIDAATQTLAFIARRGAGKTYAAGKLAECLMDAHVQVVILDSVGNWWGLRLSADGKSPAYDIPVLGGLRGDIPLEATGGHLIADIVTDTGRSLIVDASQFNKADRQRFATAFAERLWKNKKAEREPAPLHLIIEESQLIVPESVRGDAAKMVGIYEEIIRLGRNFGIGVSMISQRPQSVNKEVLNQTECLFALQVNGKHERIALRDWMTYHGAEKGLVEELPALPIGTAYVWSPQWLGILQKVKVGEKKTFDASATPKVGTIQVRRDLKPLNLDDLKERMAATIEKSKQDDPKELRKKIAELQRAHTSNARDPKVIERAVNKALSDADDRFEKLQRENVRAINDLRGRLDKIAQLATLNGNAPALTEYKRVEPRVVVDTPAPRCTVQISQSGSGDLGKCETAILSVLSQFPEGCDSGRLTLLTGYRYSGGFKNSLSALRTQGLIIGGNTEIMRITDEGLARGPFPELPQGEALISYWLNHPSLGVCERTILGQLVEVGDRGLTADELCERTDYKYSGGFKNSLSKLRTAGLLVGRNTERMRASDHLFS